MNNREPLTDYSTNSRVGLANSTEWSGSEARDSNSAKFTAVLSPDEVTLLNRYRRDKLKQDPLDPLSRGQGALPATSGEQQGLSELLAHVVKVWENPEPLPRRFVIEGLVPERAVTSLYGDGGQGKSLFALRLCFHVALGIPFAGRAVEKHNVLYIDGELDAEEFISRSYRVARGMGLDGPPVGLHYYQLPGPLTDPVIQAKVRMIREACEATFCILDSLTMSTYGADPKDAQDVIGVIKYLETLGTVLAIDHISKPPIGASNLSQFRQYGSAFKWHGERSIIQLIRAEGGGLQLLPKKSNFAGLSAPICYSLKFEDDRVCFEPISADAPEMAGIDSHLPANERVFRELASFGETGAKPEELAPTLELNPKTVRNHLTALKQANRVDSKQGLWWVKEG